MSSVLETGIIQETTTVWKVQCRLDHMTKWFNLVNDQDISTFTEAKERIQWWRDHGASDAIFRLVAVNRLVMTTENVLDV